MSWAAREIEEKSVLMRLVRLMGAKFNLEFILELLKCFCDEWNWGARIRGMNVICARLLGRFLLVLHESVGYLYSLAPLQNITLG